VRVTLAVDVSPEDALLFVWFVTTGITLVVGVAAWVWFVAGLNGRLTG
jgi:hypothetical protein